MPAEIAAKLAEMGRVIDPPKTVALCAPLQQREPYQGVKVEQDVKYGAAPPRFSRFRTGSANVAVIPRVSI
jgi:hypothetical protein